MQDRPRILYVEDDPAARLLVQRVLKMEGYEVLEAEDGLSGVETARHCKPDLILMDINMPDMDGYAVSTRLKALEETRDIPIIALTANVMLGDREMSLAAGCDGYIPKPIDVDVLPAQVAAFLKGKRERVEDREKVERLEEHTRRLVDRLERTITELRDANVKLRRMEKAKSDFIVLAGHELRTPLTLIYGYSRLLLSGGMKDHVPPQVLPMLEKVAGAAERLSSVVDDIINVALIAADQLELTFETANLGQIVHSVADQFRQASQERGQRLEVAPLSDLPPILGDPNYLKRAIGNVIGNAIKFTPDGGLIQVWCENTGDWLDLVVRDTGIGIDRDEQEHIFDKFYVLENTDFHSSSDINYKGGGLGLGLSVVRGIIAAHGGRVLVHSEGYNEATMPGSTFHLMLPLNFTPRRLDRQK